MKFTLVMFAGDIPPFIVHGSDDITTTVTEDTKGQSDNDFISLRMGGIPSQRFIYCCEIFSCCVCR